MKPKIHSLSNQHQNQSTRKLSDKDQALTDTSPLVKLTSAMLEYSQLNKSTKQGEQRKGSCDGAIGSTLGEVGSINNADVKTENNRENLVENQVEKIKPKMRKIPMKLNISSRKLIPEAVKNADDEQQMKPMHKSSTNPIKNFDNSPLKQKNNIQQTFTLSNTLTGSKIIEQTQEQIITDLDFKIPTFSSFNPQPKIFTSMFQIGGKNKLTSSGTLIASATTDEPTSCFKKIQFETSDKFYERYEIKQKLGQGASGVVFRCIKKSDNSVYVVKRTKCQIEQISTMKISYNTIKMLSHPNIIKYKSIYLHPSQNKAFLVMEYFPYPNLLKYYKEKPNGIPQSQLQNIVYQIFDAIAYMHRIGLCHRDIKPDNILYNPEQKIIKIIDFGVSREIGIGKIKQMMLTCTGTTLYKAPELFKGGFYDEFVDQWAAGITIYKLITGVTPFQQDQYIQQTIQNIQNGVLNFSEPQWNNYSSIVKDLIHSLVCPLQLRITAEQAKNSLWFTTGHKQFYESVRHKPSKKKDSMFQTCFIGKGGKIRKTNQKFHGENQQNQSEAQRNAQIRNFKISAAITGVCLEQSDCQFSDQDSNKQIEVKKQKQDDQQQKENKDKDQKKQEEIILDILDD